MPALPVPAQWITLHAIAALAALAIYVGVSLSGRQRRSPSAAIAWVVILATAPYAGLPLFLIFGSRKVARAAESPREPLRDAIRFTPGAGARVRALARSMGLPDAVPYDNLVIHQDGAHSLERLEALANAARGTLDVSTFLMGRDEVGDRLAAVLERRAKEGVRVRLLIDGAGRYFGGLRSLRQLRTAGVEVALFAPPLWAPFGRRANLRNHRKMAVADGEWLWSGGRNLAAEYFVGTHSRKGNARPWTDLTFDVRGAIAAQAVERFACDWESATGIAHGSAREPMRSLPDEARPLAQLLPSGPDFPEDTLYELLMDGCFSAQTRIVAVTPYFVPDSTLVMALTLAARRGVKIDLVLPRRSNHLLADLARPPALRELVASGANVWLAPFMLHGKLVIMDEAVAMAGSLNLDSRSLFLNYEMMVAFYDAQAIHRFVSWAENCRAGAHRLAPSRVSRLREIGEGLLRWLTFQL